MKSVCVLMSTYNGEKYIEEQIESVLSQKDVMVKLVIRDDGSSDQTIPIIKKYADQNSNISYYSDINLGSAKSFMKLLKSAPESDYYAFCDQDDFWEEMKLISAVRQIEKVEEKSAEIPVLYHSNLKIVDKDLNFIRMAHERDYNKVSAYSSLVDNPVTGCTIVMNRTMAELVNKHDPEEMTMHDSWCNIVCSFFGKKIYDNNAYIKYRQHDNNVIGMKEESAVVNIRNKVKRIKKNKLQPRLKNAVQFYRCYQKELPDETRKEIKKMVDYQKSFIDKLRLFFNFKIKSYCFKLDVRYRLLILIGEI